MQVVRRRVEGDAQDNNPLALVLRNDVDRKLVKQTVMTSVYGVTPIGAAHQVLSRLVERGWPDNNFTYKVARYGANVRSISPLLSSPAQCPPVPLYPSVPLLCFCFPNTAPTDDAGCTAGDVWQRKGHHDLACRLRWAHQRPRQGGGVDHPPGAACHAALSEKGSLSLTLAACIECWLS